MYAYMLLLVGVSHFLCFILVGNIADDMPYSVDDHRVKRQASPIRTPCNRRPCVNGGSCYLQPGGHYCICAPGYTGQQCETCKHVATTREKRTRFCSFSFLFRNTHILWKTWDRYSNIIIRQKS